MDKIAKAGRVCIMMGAGYIAGSVCEQLDTYLTAGLLIMTVSVFVAGVCFGNRRQQ